jgi:hypothetical protein
MGEKRGQRRASERERVRYSCKQAKGAIRGFFFLRTVCRMPYVECVEMLSTVKSLSLSLSLSRSLSRALSLSRARAHARARSLARSLALPHARKHARARAHTHTHTHKRRQSQTHTHRHTETQKHTQTHRSYAHLERWGGPENIISPLPTPFLFYLPAA